MSTQPQSDWFAANTPGSTATAGGDWFAANTPRPTSAGTTDWDALKQFVHGGVQTVLSAPSAIKHAFADEATPEEIQQAGGDPNEVKGAKRIGLVVGRLVGAGQIGTALDYYHTYAKATPEQRRNMESDMMSVAPEALGSALSTYLMAKGASKLIEAAPGAVSATAEAARNTSISKVTAPVRAVVQATNTALAKAPGKVGAGVGATAGGLLAGHWGAGIGAALGAGAGEAILPKIRIPGEGFGLPNEVTGGPAVAPSYEATALQSGLDRVNGLTGASGDIPLRPSMERVQRLSPDVPAATTPGSGTPAASAPATTAPAEAAAAPPALTQGESVSPAIRSKLDQALRDSLGALPPPRAGVTLRNQPVVAGLKLPEGFTPVESSSVLKGYKYDPEAQELEAITNSGQRYRTGEVTQEQFDKFEAADSKGKAWNALRGNSTPLGKYVGGKFQPYSRAGMRTATPEDVPPSTEPDQLDDTLTKMLKQVKAGKKLKDLQ